jgi:uncharacterized RDD family membrane protein YckC
MAYPLPTDATAVFGRRVLAALIDAALILIPVFMLATAQLEYKTTDTLKSEGFTPGEFCDRYIQERGGSCFDLADVNDRVYFTDGAMGGSTLLLWGGSFGLYVLLQGLTGWTIGKLVTGIRVVRDTGRPPGLGKALLRWLAWIVDGFPYFLPGLVGFIVGLTTVGHRRVGDMWAKTLVVKASSVGAPVAVPGLTTPPVASAGWAAATPPTPPPADAPHWDDARGTYIQWDPTQGVWMQWDEATKAWSPIAGQ